MKQFNKKQSRPYGADPPSGRARKIQAGHSLLQTWKASLIRRWQAKQPVLRMVLIFALVMGLYYAATLSSFFRHRLFPAYLRLNAEGAAAILNVLGQPTIVSGTTVSAGGFGIDVHRGCDGIEPSVLFAALLLAFPCPFARKIPGIVIGTVLLLTINLVRIVSLFLIGLYFPRTFHLMHADVWQAMFIVLAIAFCVLSLRWATRSSRPAAHVPV